MRFSDSSNVIDCKFLLPAGAAESNPALSAVFNQYRSNALDGFIEEFNSLTNYLPGDISLLVTVRLPITSTGEKVLFDIAMPSLGFFLKKAAIVHTFSNNNFVLLELSALLLTQYAILRSAIGVTGAFDLDKAKSLLKCFTHSLKSCSTSLGRKTFMFLMCTFTFNGVVFYKLELMRSFSRFFK